MSISCEPHTDTDTGSGTGTGDPAPLSAADPCGEVFNGLVMRYFKTGMKLRLRCKACSGVVTRTETSERRQTYAAKLDGAQPSRCMPSVSPEVLQQFELRRGDLRHQQELCHLPVGSDDEQSSERR